MMGVNSNMLDMIDRTFRTPPLFHHAKQILYNERTRASIALLFPGRRLGLELDTGIETAQTSWVTLPILCETTRGI